MIQPHIDAQGLATIDRASGDEGPFFLPLAPDFPQAGCLEEYPDLWFPFGYDDREDQFHVGISRRIAETAIDICYDCPHMIECGQYATENHILHGIWGGLTEKDRQATWAKEAA